MDDWEVSLEQRNCRMNISHPYLAEAFSSFGDIFKIGRGHYDKAKMFVHGHVVDFPYAETYSTITDCELIQPSHDHIKLQGRLKTP